MTPADRGTDAFASKCSTLQSQRHTARQNKVPTSTCRHDVGKQNSHWRMKTGCPATDQSNSSLRLCCSPQVSSCLRLWTPSEDNKDPRKTARKPTNNSPRCHTGVDQTFQFLLLLVGQQRPSIVSGKCRSLLARTLSQYIRLRSRACRLSGCQRSAGTLR